MKSLRTPKKTKGLVTVAHWAINCESGKGTVSPQTDSVKSRARLGLAGSFLGVCKGTPMRGRFMDLQNPIPGTPGWSQAHPWSMYTLYIPLGKAPIPCLTSKRPWSVRTHSSTGRSATPLRFGLVRPSFDPLAHETRILLDLGVLARPTIPYPT